MLLRLLQPVACPLSDGLNKKIDPFYSSPPPSFGISPTARSGQTEPNQVNKAWRNLPRVQTIAPKPARCQIHAPQIPMPGGPEMKIELVAGVIDWHEQADDQPQTPDQ